MLYHFIEKIYAHSINAVHPVTLLPRWIRVSGNNLYISGRCFDTTSLEKLVLIACGKAAGAMAAAAEFILKDLVTDGLCVTKYRHALPLQRITVLESGHPYPDRNSFIAGKMLIQKISSLSKNDLVLLLLSGGASSLIADVPAGCTEDEITTINKLLVNSGAGIHEINIVRKHLSHLKGGQLVKLIYPTPLISLIISDVPGNNPENIASGMTTGDSSGFQDALSVIDRYGIREKTPPSILQRLEDGVAGRVNETPKPGSHFFTATTNEVIAGNQTALEEAAFFITQAGMAVIKSDQPLTGSLTTAVQLISATLIGYKGRLPCCFLWGGETTVKVKGAGYGGRNQHLALSILHELKPQWGNRAKLTVLCAGTDGTDGPTDAAGAFIDSDMFLNKEISNESINSALSTFNSYDFFSRHGRLLKSGATQTNVMDIVVAIIA